jgi:hypothetical protein
MTRPPWWWWWWRWPVGLSGSVAAAGPRGSSRSAEVEAEAAALAAARRLLEEEEEEEEDADRFLELDDGGGGGLAELLSAAADDEAGDADPLPATLFHAVERAPLAAFSSDDGLGSRSHLTEGESRGSRASSSSASSFRLSWCR